MPETLPKPTRISDDELARWKSRRVPHRISPRRLLSGVLLALMCVLFVVGVMNLIWIAILTAFVLIEKIGPAGAIVARAAGAAMIAVGVIAIV